MKLTKSKLKQIIKEELQQLLREQQLPVESAHTGVSPAIAGMPHYETHAKIWPRPDASYHLVDVLQDPTHPDWPEAYSAAQTIIGPMAPEMASQEFNLRQLHDQLSYKNLESKWLTMMSKLLAGEDPKHMYRVYDWMLSDLKSRYPDIHPKGPSN